MRQATSSIDRVILGDVFVGQKWECRMYVRSMYHGWLQETCPEMRRWVFCLFPGPINLGYGCMQMVINSCPA